jgi:FkbM family methyltransferase
MKKITIPKLIAYVRNKYYTFNFNNELVEKSKSLVVNHEEYIEGLLNPKNGRKNYTVEFTNGIKIHCRENDLSAVGETCIIDDYGKLLHKKEYHGLVVFDIGAHIGSFSVNAAHKGAHVYAFEPNKENYALLLENIKLNKLEDRITAYNIAITSDGGKKYLEVSEQNFGGHILSNAQSNEHAVATESETIEHIMKINSLSKIDLIKIDTEGAEYDIFGHISKETLDKVMTIVGEYHLFLDKPSLNFSRIKADLRKSFTTVKRYSPYYFYAERT